MAQDTSFARSIIIKRKKERKKTKWTLTRNHVLLLHAKTSLARHNYRLAGNRTNDLPKGTIGEQRQRQRQRQREREIETEKEREIETEKEIEIETETREQRGDARGWSPRVDCYMRRGREREKERQREREKGRETRRGRGGRG